MTKVTTNQNQTWEIQTENGVSVNGSPVDASILEINPNEYHLIINNKTYKVQVIQDDLVGRDFSMSVNGRPVETHVINQMEELLDQMGMSTAPKKSLNLMAPMPGLVLGIPVSVGDEVEEGSPLVVLEAMKMENILKAAHSGVIKSIEVEPQDTVSKNQLLVTFV